MTRLHRNVNIAAVILPFAAYLAAIPLLWNDFVGPAYLAIFVGVYLATALGVIVGFHRLLTHRSFKTHGPIRYLLAVLGSMSVQGDVISWVSDHRKHHAFADEDGDPHSPHGHGGGLKGALHGLYHAHVGWLFENHSRADAKRYARDLLDDPGMKLISRNFIPIVLLSLLIPALLGYLATGTAAGALTAFFWAGLVRIFMVHHVTWSINSICHFFGRRRFDTDDESTNVLWLALPSLGESWHHNHHAFPLSAVHGMRWWELDVSALVIRALRRAGLAWNVVTIAPERQAMKLDAG